MVRVGGGWMALDEFLVKNDPCRGKEMLCQDNNTMKVNQFCTIFQHQKHAGYNFGHLLQK